MPTSIVYKIIIISFIDVKDCEMARPIFVLINFTRFKRLYSYRLFHMKRESMITLFGAYPKFGKMSLQHVAQMS